MNLTTRFITDRPYRLFIIGLILTATATVLLYELLPNYNLLGGQWTIYLPGHATPQVFTDKESYNNTDILLELGVYNLAYWSICILIYTALTHITRIRFYRRHINFHFALSVLAFVFIICFNDRITFADIFRPEPSAIYISAEAIKFDFSQFDRELLFKGALTKPTSLIGIALLTFGNGLFLMNINKGLKRNEE